MSRFSSWLRAWFRSILPRSSRQGRQPPPWRFVRALGSASERIRWWRRLGWRIGSALAALMLVAMMLHVLAGHHARDVLLAWTFTASRGSAADKVSDTTISMNPSATLDVGNVILVFCASDNAATAETQDTTEHTIADSASNHWHKVKEMAFSAGGAAADAVTGSMWIAKLTSQITAAGTITLTTSAAQTSKCIGAVEVASTAGAWNVIDAQADGILAANATTVSSLTIKSTAVLAVGVAFTEGPNGDAYTEDTDYSNTFSFGTTTGTANTNVSIRAGFRIATLTGDTYNPTLGTARDKIVMLALLAEAATPTRTHMVKTSGGHYTSIGSWESAQQRDLTSSSAIFGEEIAQAEYWSGAFSAQNVTVDGWTTSATYYIRLYVPSGERHTGTPASGAKHTGTANNVPFTNLEENFRMEFLEVVGNNSAHCCRNAPSGSCDIQYIGCIFNGTGGSAPSRGLMWNAGSGTFKVRNCIAFFFDKAGMGTTTIDGGGPSGTATFYNCTIADCGKGNSTDAFSNGSGTVRPKSVVCQNPNVALGSGSVHFSGSFTAAEYNVSGDGTAPGTNATTSATVSFNAAASNDFRLASGDTVCKNTGTDLSADATFPFTDDIDGTTRPQGAAWDRGADEAAVSATSAPPSVDHVRDMMLLGV